jgi:hypothetical protein
MGLDIVQKRRFNGIQQCTFHQVAESPSTSRWTILGQFSGGCRRSSKIAKRSFLQEGFQLHPPESSYLTNAEIMNCTDDSENVNMSEVVRFAHQRSF